MLVLASARLVAGPAADSATIRIAPTRAVMMAIGIDLVDMERKRRVPFLCRFQGALGTTYAGSVAR